MTPLWGARTYIMGIVNATPDSFSGDGLAPDDHVDLDRVVDQARRFVAAGADILDVGGQSTRPGGAPVSATVEAARVVPAVRALRDAVDVPISIDTFHAAVATAALAAGADWINDVRALRYDPAMAGVVAAAGCPVVLMHNRMPPRSAAERERLADEPSGIAAGDIVAVVAAELQTAVDHALAAGIRPANIILDPGIGFGKTVDQNLRLINELERLQTLGYPLLLGPSRKGFIGHVLGRPVDERVFGTVAAVAVGIARGADIVRVHDVAAVAQVVRLADAIVRGRARPAVVKEPVSGAGAV